MPPSDIYRFVVKFLTALCIIAFVTTIVLSAGFPDAVDARELSENVCMMSLSALLGIITGDSMSRE